jgi:methyl-accepting chemotaxis protein
MEEAVAASYVDVDASDGDSVNAVVNNDVWSLASGMFRQLRSDVGEFVNSISEENKEVVEEMKQKSSEVVATLQRSMSERAENTSGSSQAVETVAFCESGLCSALMRFWRSLGCSR